MTKFERCIFWFTISCIVSLFNTHASFSHRRKIINMGCQQISSEFNGTNVFDSQSQIGRFDVIGNEKKFTPGEEYSVLACQKTFDTLKNKNFVSTWGINTGIYWLLLSIGFYASENKNQTGF